MKPTSVRASVLILICAAILLTTTYTVSRWRPCSGLRDCYLSWNLFWNDGDRLAGERKFALSQFAASSKLIAFSTPVEPNATGLIFFNRENQQTKLIYEGGAAFFAPFLSSDSERPIFIKRGSSNREIISCLINGWICRSFLRTENSLRSPVEIDRDTIAYASSPLIVGYDKKKRFSRYDVFLKRRDEPPVQVTNFGVYSLDPLSASNSRILFSVFNGPYDIYSMQINQLTGGGMSPQASKLPVPDKAIIVDAAVSPDDQRTSFLQAETVKGQASFQYNLHLANSEAVTLRTIKVEGIAMSGGVFDQNSLIYNELFEDHYRISKLDLSTDKIEEIAVIQHSSPDVQSLERIKLTFE
jgi:hypothetical protein